MKISALAWGIMTITTVIVALYFFDRYEKRHGKKGFLSTKIDNPKILATINGEVATNSPAAILGSVTPPTPGNPMSNLNSTGTGMQMDAGGNITPVNTFVLSPSPVSGINTNVPTPPAPPQPLIQTTPIQAMPATAPILLQVSQPAQSLPTQKANIFVAPQPQVNGDFSANALPHAYAMPFDGSMMRSAPNNGLTFQAYSI